MTRARALQTLLLTAVVLAALATDLHATTGQSRSPLTRFDFWGFSIAPDPQEPGDELEIVGIVNPGLTFLPFPLSFPLAEYTVHIHGLVLAQVLQNGPLLELHFEGGFLDIYEDPSFNAPFQAGTDPAAVPDLDPTEVPAHFTDGEHLFGFRFRDYVALFLEPSGIGTIAFVVTELRAVGGSGLPILQAEHLVVGWHLGGGYTDDEGAFIPEGYGMRYDTLLQWENPLPVEPATWGRIKAAFE